MRPLTALRVAFSAFVVAGCSSSSSPGVLRLSSTLLGADAGTVVVGTPCVLDQELDTSFGGFDTQEIEVEGASGTPSGSAVCLGYYFQGRATCPYGQSADGGSPTGGPCLTPDGKAVTAEVAPQCTTHLAASSVVWSCRCANPAGRTDDGDAYCSCPSGTACAQAVASLGTAGDSLSGAYCVPDPDVAEGRGSCTVTCDPTAHPCP